MGKKGLSEVISVTLLILMVIVVGVFVYSFSNNIIGIQKKQLNSALTLNLRASIDDITITGALATFSPFSLGSKGKEMIIIVTRIDNEDKKIFGIKFIFTDRSGNYNLYVLWTLLLKQGFQNLIQ